MRNPEKTIGKMIDKAKTSFIAYVDDEGFPITKAMLKRGKEMGLKKYIFRQIHHLIKSNILSRITKQVFILSIRDFIEGLA